MTQLVYCVFCQENMTDGSGAMVLDSIWFSMDLASEYVDTQPGVMGRRAKWSETEFGDWMIVPLNVMDSRNDISRLNKERQERIERIQSKYK